MNPGERVLSDVHINSRSCQLPDKNRSGMNQDDYAKYYDTYGSL